MSVSVMAQLQKFDGNVEVAQQRLAELERWLSDRHELEALNAEAAAARAAATQSRGQLRERELELQSLEARIADLDQKLYSGRIRNPKELEGFEKESRMFKQNQDKLEESVLKLMETSDRAQAEALQLEKQLQDMEASRQQSEGRWQHELAELRERLSGWQDQLRALRSQADGDELALYDRLRRTRGGLAVAPVRGDKCGACGIGLSSHALERVRDGQSLAQCDNCGRILSDA